MLEKIKEKSDEAIMNRINSINSVLKHFEKFFNSEHIFQTIENKADKFELDEIKRESIN